MLLRPTLVAVIIMMALTISVNGQLACANILNVNTTAPLLWKGECICVAGYIWNPSTAFCDACSSYAGTTTGSVQGSCKCTGSKFWKGSSRSCIQPTTAIDCNVSPNNGVTSPAQTPKACNCIAGYTWNTYFFRCQYDCTGLTFYDVGVKPSGQNVCPCITNTVWSATSKTC